jgi:hypothetical protein
MLAGNYPWTKPHGRLNELGPTIQPNRSTVLCDERIDGCWLTQVGRNAERVGTEGLQPLAPIGVRRVSTVELGPRSPTSCNSASVVCLRRRHRGARRPPPAQERSKVRRNTSAPQRDRCIDPRRTPVPSSQNEEDRRFGEIGRRIWLTGVGRIGSLSVVSSSFVVSSLLTRMPEERGELSASWPFARPFLEQSCALAVDHRLHDREDRTLDRGGHQNLPERVAGLQRRWRV